MSCIYLAFKPSRTSGLSFPSYIYSLLNFSIISINMIFYSFNQEHQPIDFLYKCITVHTILQTDFDFLW